MSEYGVNLLDLSQYLALTMVLSLAIGGYIGVTFLLTAKVYDSFDKRVGYRRSLKPEVMSGLTFIVLISPLVGTLAYLVSLTVTN